jgi:DNA-binding HxlR family transcriptional regulator
MGALDRIVELFHHRWAVPMLAEMHRCGGVRFVQFVNGMGIPRDTVRRTLEVMVRWRLVKRNPGYGHPLRPEYILTRRGARVGSVCADLMAVIRRLGIQDEAQHKWTMPVLYRLGNSARGQRFSQLEESLPGVTPRALAMALKEMKGVGLIERRVVDTYPPSSLYQLAPKGRRTLPLLMKLSRSK